MKKVTLELDGFSGQCRVTVAPHNQCHLAVHVGTEQECRTIAEAYTRIGFELEDKLKTKKKTFEEWWAECYENYVNRSSPTGESIYSIAYHAWQSAQKS